ncbi:DUF58 domain-containing protein [Alkalicoccobacillus porphyridii]|uniref:DUF58 domain-containing protein n=1 Tax=Alkalicoccobacillus porphyridii TaxID=2597270 RepID=A0A553ZT90_9BACI|nr:DUF58 domain-containing protein [Alkalicoccobacillus porphyridii]TSB44670.1 DUF58 domain-containing protein [Alkalicoccobacillus porphyridii]
MKRKLSKLSPFFKGLAGILLLAGCYAYAMFQGGFVSWFLFYSVLLIGVLIGSSILFTTQIVPQRKVLSTTLYSGDSVEIDIMFRRKIFQPFTYLRVQDIVPKKIGTSSGQQAMFFLTLSKNMTFRYQIHNLRRGLYQFDELEVTVSDFFGWFERKQRVSAHTEVRVFPRYSKLGHAEAFQSQQQAQGMQVQPSFREEERSLAGVRDYVAGDRLTSIDWKQSARKRQLMTKEFETYQGKSTIIAFDPYGPSVTDKAFEKAVEQVASMASTFIDAQIDSELAVYFDDWKHERIKSSTWISALTLLSTVQKNTSPAPSFHRVYEQWSNRSVYYVCPCLDERAFSTLERLVMERADVKVCLLEMEPEQIKIADRLRNKGIETIFISS